ncbi:MAG: hypothetical protein IJF07_07045 [Lachnospiraceae bacterium]|nr:hypothetical protein [Lachnospiraceae bacterium]
MDTFEKIMIAIFVVPLLFAPIYAYICHLISKKKMETGVDKRKIQYVLQDIVPPGESYTVAYASWYRMDYKGIGRHYTTNYWYYAIGFNESRIYIAPLMLEDGEIYYSNYSCIEKSMVSKVESEPQYGKITLFGKNDKLLAHLQVEDENNSSHGNGNINLYQKEEAKAFRELVENWTAEINNGMSEDNQVDEIINEAAAGKHVNQYEDILKYTQKISSEDKKEIFKLLNEGKKIEAIKRIRFCTGLGLADVAKIAENPNMYL